MHRRFDDNAADDGIGAYVLNLVPDLLGQFDVSFD